MSRARPAKVGVTVEQLRLLALALPGVEEGLSYGTPAFRVKGKFFARLWEDLETLVLKLSFDERDMLLAANPEAFFTTDHYRNYPTVLVRLAAVRSDELGALLQDSWNLYAPKRLRGTAREP